MFLRSGLHDSVPVRAGAEPVLLGESLSGPRSVLGRLRSDTAHEPNAPAATRTWSLFRFLAPDDGRRPVLAMRLAVFPLLFIPWLILHESGRRLGPLPNAFEGSVPGELHWPIFQWMELLYVSPYVLVMLAPLVIATNRLLRRFVLAGVLATVIGHLLFLAVPLIATPRP